MRAVSRFTGGATYGWGVHKVGASGAGAVPHPGECALRIKEARAGTDEQRGTHPVFMLRPALNTLLTRRMFPVVGIAGIVLLAAFAGWAGMIMTSAAQEVRRSTELSDAFQRARYAAAEEALTARAYQLAPDPMLRTDLQRSRLALEESLSVAIAKGSPHDQAVARRVLQMNVQALATIDRLFDAVNRADAARVAVIDKASLRPLLGAEQDMLDAAGATHRAQAVASLRSSQRSERVMVVMTLVSLALGVLLVFAVG